MNNSTGMIFRARTILPVSQPPIENGALVISGNRIRAVGSWPDLRPHANGNIFDLCEVIRLAEQHDCVIEIVASHSSYSFRNLPENRS